jgi:hypothetical protein
VGAEGAAGIAVPASAVVATATPSAPPPQGGAGQSFRRGGAA